MSEHDTLVMPIAKMARSNDKFREVVSQLEQLNA